MSKGDKYILGAGVAIVAGAVVLVGLQQSGVLTLGTGYQYPHGYNPAFSASNFTRRVGYQYPHGYVPAFSASNFTRGPVGLQSYYLNPPNHGKPVSTITYTG